MTSEAKDSSETQSLGKTKERDKIQANREEIRKQSGKIEENIANLLKHAEQTNS